MGLEDASGGGPDTIGSDCLAGALVVMLVGSAAGMVDARCAAAVDDGAGAVEHAPTATSAVIKGSTRNGSALFRLTGSSSRRGRPDT